MPSLLTPQTKDPFLRNGVDRSNERLRIATRQRHAHVLALHLSGKKAAEIAEITGYSYGRVIQILNDEPEVEALRQQHLNVLDKEFQAMWSRIIAKVEEALDSNNMDVALRAVDIWMKAVKKYKVDAPQGNTFNLTAEDIVLQIMQRSGEDGQPRGTDEARSLPAL